MVTVLMRFTGTFLSDAGERTYSGWCKRCAAPYRRKPLDSHRFSRGSFDGGQLADFELYWRRDAAIVDRDEPMTPL